MKILRKIIFFIWYHLFHKHKLNRTVKEKILRRTFLVYPTVFNPKSYYSSSIFVEFICGLNDLKGKQVLDMGCGSGIIGIFAALNGAEVTAVDINPEAIKCTIENANLNNVSDKISAFESNLFACFSSSRLCASAVRFDIIFFNPPYYPKEPKNNFELGFNAGKDYRVIREFAKQSKVHLKENGIIYMIISSDINPPAVPAKAGKGGQEGLEILKNIFNEQGFNFNLALTKRKFFETFYVIRLQSENR